MKRSFKTVDMLRERYSNTCQFYFSIFRYTQSINFNKDTNLLKLLLNSEEFTKEYPQLLPIKEKALYKSVELDRYEFEGSLISMLIHGTCTDSIVSNEDEARMIANNLLCELRLVDTDFIAFRLDDQSWSQEIYSSTYSKFYVVYQSLYKYWIYFGFADFY